jgi:YesN/AraC family two-component response regulator
VLKYARQVRADAMVIIITGHASLETALTAIKEGAYDYIRKPCRLDEIKIVVDNAIDKIKLNRENRELLDKLQEAYQELISLKKEIGGTEKTASLNFFSSDISGLHYLYGSQPQQKSYLEKLQALSYLKDDGTLTHSEFNEFKRHLLKMMDARK